MADVLPSLSIFVSVLLQLGMGLAVGSSTYAIIFYFKSKRDGVIDPTERSFLHVVYRVLRISLLMIIASLLLQSLFAFQAGAWAEYATASYWMFWIIIAVVLVNALLTDWHVMPMNIGPAIAAGSWYTLYLIYTLRVLQIDLPASYVWVYLVYYAAFVVFMAFFLRIVDYLLTLDRSRSAPSVESKREAE